MSLLISKRKKERNDEREDRFIVESSNDDNIVRGPFGLWFFPILNFLRFLVSRMRGVRETSKRRRLAIYDLVRDERGRIIQIVEREIEE